MTRTTFANLLTSRGRLIAQPERRISYGAGLETLTKMSQRRRHPMPLYELMNVHCLRPSLVQVRVRQEPTTGNGCTDDKGSFSA